MQRPFETQQDDVYRIRPLGATAFTMGHKITAIHKCKWNLEFKCAHWSSRCSNHLDSFLLERLYCWKRDPTKESEAGGRRGHGSRRKTAPSWRSLQAKDSVSTEPICVNRGHPCLRVDSNALYKIFPSWYLFAVRTVTALETNQIFKLQVLYDHPESAHLFPWTLSTIRRCWKNSENSMLWSRNAVYFLQNF